MRIYDEEPTGRAGVPKRRPIGDGDELLGAAFLAIGLLACVLFWSGVYLLAGGPLP